MVIQTLLRHMLLILIGTNTDSYTELQAYLIDLTLGDLIGQFEGQTFPHLISRTGAELVHTLLLSTNLNSYVPVYIVHQTDLE